MCRLLDKLDPEYRLWTFGSVGGGRVGLHERLRHYIKDMGLTNDGLAHVLGHKGKTRIDSYTKQAAPRNPKHSDLMDMADRMGVSIYWLVGRVTTPKWSPEIQMAQMWLRSTVKEVTAIDLIHRVQFVILHLGQQVPLCREHWFMAGVLGVEPAALVGFLEGHGRLMPDSVNRLADFTLLPQVWFMGGTLPDDKGLNLGEYTQAFIQLAERGVTGDELLKQVEVITQRSQQIRRMMSLT